MNRRNMSLIEPNAELKTEFLQMSEEYAAAGDNRYQSAVEDFEAYLERLASDALGVNLPSDRAPQTVFWLVGDGRIFGQSKLRHRLTPELEDEGGHIGYDIRPSARRKGYGTLILELTLKKAENLGLNRVLLTCDADNTASAKIIEKNGGNLSGQAVSRISGKLIFQYWIQL